MTDELSSKTVRDPSPAGAAVRLPRGALVGRYIVVALLGEGGMGVVYAAYDPELGRRVALKLLRSDRGDGEEGRLRLLAEAQAMARLAHENVIAVYDVGDLDGQVFVAMEHVDGRTLRALCDRQRPWRDVLALFMQAGRGLAAAHRAGLVHRDFKPHNVLVSRDGRARVLDFGLARPSEAAPRAARHPSEDPDQPLDESVTETGALMGTPAYMAPEQLAGRAATAASDQWSFAVALWEALFGARPFAGEAAARAGRFSPPAWGTAPAWLRAALERALSVDPAARYPSMNALLAALARDPSLHRRRIAAGVAFAAALALGAVGATRLVRQPAAPCPDEARAGMPAGYGAAWSAARRDACEDTRLRGEQSEEQMALRLRCLDELADEAAALVELGGDAAAAARLPPVAHCADVRALAGAPAAPDRHLAQARALGLMGRDREALALAGIVVATAQARDDCPRAAGGLVVAAAALARLGQHDQAAGTLDEAVWAGERCHHDRAVAEAWTMQAAEAGARRRFDEAHRLERLAAAAIERLGGPDLLEADRLDAVAAVAALEGQADAAARARQAASRLRERGMEAR